MTDMQSQDDVYFVRREMVQSSPPPTRVHGVVPWLRTNLFSSIGNSAPTM